MKRCAISIAALVACPAFGEGDYGPVPIDEDEWHLIESSRELEGYFAAQSLLYENGPLLELVRRIGHSLTPAPTDDYIEYEFFVLRDPSPNAFALPNGHVYVHTGMLARLADESQLAGLLAHEINHVAGHHGILGTRAAKKKTVAALIVGGLGGGWGAAISIGLQTSIYGHSRELEQEADNRGAALLLESPYDPHALPEVFDILGRDYEGLYPRMATVWSTHPEIQARAQTSRALVADMPQRERGVEEFELTAFPLRVLTIHDYIQDDYPRTALALADDLVQRYPNDPELTAVLGDAWQAMGAQPQFASEELSNSDKRRNLRTRIRYTREQRLAELLETPEGRAAYAENLARAETTYREALALDESFAPAQRGLAEVYEQRGQNREAAEAYLKYVRSAPDAADRAIVVARLRTLAARIRAEEGEVANEEAR